MTALLTESYDALAGVVSRLREQDAWAPTGCAGWCVRDLVWHLHADAVRGLVAAHTPAGGEADCDGSPTGGPGAATPRPTSATAG